MKKNRGNKHTSHYSRRWMRRTQIKNEQKSQIPADPLARFNQFERSTLSRAIAPLFRGRVMPTLQMIEEYLQGRLVDLLAAIERTNKKLTLWLKRRRNVKRRISLTLPDLSRLAQQAAKT